MEDRTMTGAVITNRFYSYDSLENDVRLRDVLSSFSTLYVTDETLLPLSDATVLFSSSADSPSETEKVVSALVDRGVEGIIVIGGDAICSVVASALINKGKKAEGVVILGYLAGGAGIGPIARHGLTKESMRSRKRIDALKVESGGSILAYAFNEVDFSTTFLGSVDGELSDLDAASFLRDGRLVHSVPSGEILTPSFSLSLNGNVLLTDPGHDIRQISFSPLWQDNLIGRAVFGGLIYSTDLKHSAAVALISRITVTGDTSQWNYKGVTTTSHVVFEECDRITLSGLSPSVSAVIDGNPYRIDGGEVTVSVVPNAVTIVA